MELLSRLTKEHGKILQGLDYLCQARGFLEKNRQPPRKFFETAIQFFSEYADRFHHYKEEYLLFTFLASKKEGAIDLEMGSLRYQHELNRDCLAKIEKSLSGYERGSEIAVTTLLKNLAAFISILRRHIYREDSLFFPMAVTELEDDEKMLLQQQFNDEEEAMDARGITMNNKTLLEEMAVLITGTQDVV